MKFVNEKRNLKTFIYIAIVIVVVAFLLFNANGVFKYFSLKNKISRINSEIEESDIKLINLKKEIDSLNNSNKKIEKVAREKYFMHKPNEKALRIEITKNKEN